MIIVIVILAGMLLSSFLVVAAVMLSSWVSQKEGQREVFDEESMLYEKSDTSVPNGSIEV